MWNYNPNEINKPGRLKMNHRYNRTIDGKQVERPQHLYPYSYSRVCIYENGFESTDRVVWSDRLLTDDRAYELWNQILGTGQYLSHKAPDLVEEWLRIYLAKPNLILTGVEEECNVSNGYPYWLLYFRCNDAQEGGSHDDRVTRLGQN